MTRTLGDFAAKKIGLISTPEIQHIELTTNDEFIVMASAEDLAANAEFIRRANEFVEARHHTDQHRGPAEGFSRPPPPDLSVWGRLN